MQHAAQQKTVNVDLSPFWISLGGFTSHNLTHMCMSSAHTFNTFNNKLPCMSCKLCIRWCWSVWCIDINLFVVMRQRPFSQDFLMCQSRENTGVNNTLADGLKVIWIWQYFYSSPFSKLNVVLFIFLVYYCLKLTNLHVNVIHTTFKSFLTL